MKRLAIITVAFLVLLPASGFGQTRSRTSKRSTPKTTAPAVDPGLIAARTEAANKARELGLLD